MKRRTKKGWSLVLLLAFVASMVLPTGAAASDTIYDLTTFRYEVLSDGTPASKPCRRHNIRLARWSFRLRLMAIRCRRCLILWIIRRPWLI